MAWNPYAAIKSTMTQSKQIDENLKAHFLSLYCLTVSDNDVNPKELETLYRIGLEYGISKEDIQAIVLEPNNALVTPDTIEEKVTYLYDLTRIAYADGKIVDEEKKLIGKYAIQFGFPPENTNAIVDFFLDSVKNGKTIHKILDELK